MSTATCRDCDAEVEVVGGRFAQHGQCPGWFAKVDDHEGWELSLESRFTDPRPDCPHPERWHSHDADSTEMEVTELVAAFVRALQPDVVVETGTAWGQTARAIGQALVDNGRHGVLHTIEPDPERCAAVRALLGGMPVIVHETTSLEWIAGLEEGDTWFGGDQLGERPKVGFAWFDSLHHLRVPEFRALYPHLAKGSIVGFHDTGPHQGGLHDEIVSQLEWDGVLLPMRLPTPRGVTFGEVC